MAQLALIQTHAFPSVCFVAGCGGTFARVLKRLPFRKTAFPTCSLLAGTAHLVFTHVTSPPHPTCLSLHCWQVQPSQQNYAGKITTIVGEYSRGGKKGRVIAVEADDPLELSSPMKVLYESGKIRLVPWEVIPHSSLLTPHSTLLTPHSTLLTPHSSLLTPHSALNFFSNNLSGDTVEAW